MGNKQGKETDRTRDREKLLAQYGVLVPPSFGTATDLISPASHDAVKKIAPHTYVGTCSLPHIWVESNLTSPLRQMICGSREQRLLGEENMITGIWISASPSHDSHLVASVFDTVSASGGCIRGDPNTAKRKIHFEVPTAGSLSGAKLFTVDYPWWKDDSINDNKEEACNARNPAFIRAGIGVQANVSNPSSPSSSGGLFIRHERSGIAFFSSLRDMAAINVDASSRVCKTGLSFMTPPLRGKEKGSGLRCGFGSSLLLPEDPAFSIKGIESWFAIQGRRFFAAAEINAPINDLPGDDISFSSRTKHLLLSPFVRDPSYSSGGTIPRLSYYASVDVTDSSATKGMPPIFLSLHKDNTGRSEEMGVTVSQVINFDRGVTNLLETRCPKIRNTVSWAVQLKRNRSFSIDPSPSETKKENDANCTVSSGVNAAVAWQVNRGLCYKMLLNNTGLSGAIILKRWTYPQITFSLIGGFKGGKPYQGVGFQVDTGPDVPARASYADQSKAGSYIAETKVELPSDMGSKTPEGLRAELEEPTSRFF